MLTSNQEAVMINHVLNRRNKHLAQLEKENAEFNVIQTWRKFYSKLLVKYNFYEVSNYGSN